MADTQFSPEYLQRLQEISEEFDDLLAKRYEEGSKEYGPYTFMNRDDLFVMIYEELADTSNWARFQYIKLRMMEEALHGSSDHPAGEAHGAGEDKLPSGAGTFVPGKKLHRLLPPDGGVQDPR